MRKWSQSIDNLNETRICGIAVNSWISVTSGRQVSYVSHWRSEHSLGLEGGGTGWKNAKLNFNASYVASGKLKNTAVLTLSTPVLSQVISYLILRYPTVGKNAHVQSFSLFMNAADLCSCHEEFQYFAPI